MVRSCIETMPVDSGILQVSPWTLVNPDPCLNIFDLCRTWMDEASSILAKQIDDALLKSLTHGQGAVSLSHHGVSGIQNLT